MSDFFKLLVNRVFSGALLLCFVLGLLVTSCSNEGVALNSDAVVREFVSMELGEAAESTPQPGSLDDAITGSGL